MSRFDATRLLGSVVPPAAIPVYLWLSVGAAIVAALGTQPRVGGDARPQEVGPSQNSRPAGTHAALGSIGGEPPAVELRRARAKRRGRAYCCREPSRSRDYGLPSARRSTAKWRPSRPPPCASFFSPDNRSAPLTADGDTWTMTMFTSFFAFCRSDVVAIVTVSASRLLRRFRQVRRSSRMTDLTGVFRSWPFGSILHAGASPSGTPCALSSHSAAAPGLPLRRSGQRDSLGSVSGRASACAGRETDHRSDCGDPANADSSAIERCSRCRGGTAETPPSDCQFTGLISPTLVGMLCLMVVFFYCYLPALTNDYALADDYYDFLQGPHSQGTGLGWVFDKRLMEGRPILAAVYYASAWFVDTLFDIRWIRLLGILGVAVASWCVFHELVRQGFDRIPSFAVAVMTGSSVPFQMVASWATTSALPYAFAISYAAFRIAEHSLTRKSTTRYALIIASTVCLLMAFYIFQPTALSFWAFFAIGILRKQEITRNDGRRILVFLCITALATTLSYLTFKIALNTLPYPDYPHRGHLIGISDILGRISWLIERMSSSAIFPVSTDEYRYLEIWPLRFFPLAVILAGLVLYLAGRSSFVKKGAIVCALPVLCHGIMLVTDWHDPLHSRMALGFLVIFYAFLAMHGYARHIGRVDPSIFINYAVGGLALLGVALAYWHNERQNVRTNIREIEFIRSELQQHDLASYDAIHVVRPECTGRAFVLWGYIAPSSCADWAANSMVKFVLIDMSADTLPLRISNSAHGDNYVPHTNTLVVDMEKGVRIYRDRR